MESIRAYNMKLVSNILPMHVAQHFLKAQNEKDEVRVLWWFDKSSILLSYKQVPHQQWKLIQRLGEVHFWHRMKQLSNISFNVSWPMAGIKQGIH